jgi:hypothetical protein
MGKFAALTANSALVWLAVASLLSGSVAAQTRHKPITSLRWADGVRIDVEGVSDSAVHVNVFRGIRTVVPKERVDYFREWLDSAASVMAAGPQVDRGEYLLMREGGGGQIRFVRRVTADSSEYLLSFYGDGTNLPILATASPHQFGELVSALQAADTAARRLSGLSTTWDGRRR